MPLYELSLIIRVLPKIELKNALRRPAELILSQGGVLRKIENLGTKTLPYRMKKDEAHYTEGSYFILQFDSPSTFLEMLKDECRRDVDIIRPRLSPINLHQQVQCTLHEELLPPAYRPEVLKLLSVEKKKMQTARFKMGVDFNPF